MSATVHAGTNTDPLSHNGAPMNGVPVPSTNGVTPLPDPSTTPQSPSSAKPPTPTLIPANTPVFPMDSASLATGIEANSFAVKKGLPIIRKMRPYIDARKPFYSFEYFPPKTREGVENLYERLDRMSQLEPLFMDLTWGAGGSTADLTLEISGNGQQMCSGEIMMHLTCTNLPRTQVRAALEKAKQLGIRNILALRGDPPKGSEAWEACEDGFQQAVDLVRYIRAEYGDYFGVAVAGYPEGHISAASMDEDVRYLKEKFDAGADFVITQLFYDTTIFLQWVQKCRAAGITCPIVPGIMPIQNYTGFKRMVGFCKTSVPDHISEALEPIKNDDAKVKAYGIELGVRMCRELLDAGIPGLHFYTLNLERSVTNILEELGFVNAKTNGRLPWKQSLVARRQKEEVRPIFWANRPQSYLDRTIHWTSYPEASWTSFASSRYVTTGRRGQKEAGRDDFPNSRWGDRTSPAFGDLSDYHLCNFRTGTAAERQKLWGMSPSQPQHIFDVFAAYIDGDVPRLPWCENAIQLETLPLKETLRRINAAGFLTINSQPRVNGASSTDPAVGWGGAGGYVYQKAYLEFFCSKPLLQRLTALAAQPEHVSLTYTAVDVRGDVITNLQLDGGEQSVNAVTWGVFPSKEIIQPTIVDVDSFMAWKDEAFALWVSQWRDVYESESDSWRLIDSIKDTYYLVNVVDNDYVKGDMFAFFTKLIQ